MISKQEFINIIDKLKEVNDFVDEVNTKARKLNDAIISDFFSAASLSISHENLVVRLLENMFNDKDIISWWIYEVNYGRNTDMAWVEENGVKTYLYTAEDLYNYLIKNMEV